MKITMVPSYKRMEENQIPADENSDFSNAKKTNKKLSLLLVFLWIVAVLIGVLALISVTVFILVSLREKMDKNINEFGSEPHGAMKITGTTQATTQAAVDTTTTDYATTDDYYNYDDEYYDEEYYDDDYYNDGGDYSHSHGDYSPQNFGDSDDERSELEGSGSSALDTEHDDIFKEPHGAADNSAEAATDSSPSGTASKESTNDDVFAEDLPLENLETSESGGTETDSISKPNGVTNDASKTTESKWLTLSHLIQSDECKFEYNVDYNRHDLENHNFVYSAEDCCDLCTEHSVCSFWTWNPRIDRCYFKYSDAGRKAWDGEISGPSRTKKF